MKLKEVTQVGFYESLGDPDRNIVFEVYENTNENWLQDEPDATLLADMWCFDHTDEDERSWYNCDGNLLVLAYGSDETNVEVKPITDTQYTITQYGDIMVEKKPTYKDKYILATKKLQSIKSVISTNKTDLSKQILDIIGVV